VSGLCLHPSGALGASPDGFVDIVPDHHLEVHGAVELVPQIVEVKCPHSLKTCTVADGIGKKNFCLSKIYSTIVTILHTVVSCYYDVCYIEILLNRISLSVSQANAKQYKFILVLSMVWIY
jgi:hypothetical protein